jgi:hypothetical protein
MVRTDGRAATSFAEAQGKGTRSVNPRKVNLNSVCTDAVLECQATDSVLNYKPAKRIASGRQAYRRARMLINQRSPTDARGTSAKPSR